MRRRRLPPDTRPKWNDPDLPVTSLNGTFTANEVQAWAKERCDEYDRQPAWVRYLWRRSINNSPMS